MTHIDWYEDEQAVGEYAEILREWKQQNPHRDRFPGILKCFAHRPDFLRRVMQFSNEVHFSDGYLDRRTHEMIATLVSSLNQCPY